MDKQIAFPCAFHPLSDKTKWEVWAGPAYAEVTRNEVSEEGTELGWSGQHAKRGHGFQTHLRQDKHEQ